MKQQRVTRRPSRRTTPQDTPADRRPELSTRTKKIMERLEGR